MFSAASAVKASVSAIRVDQCADCSSGRKLTKDFKPLGVEFNGKAGTAGHIAARAIKARDEAASNGIGDRGESDRNGVGRCLGGKRGHGAADCRYDPHRMPDKFGGERGQTFVVVIRTTAQDCHVLAENKSAFLQAGVKAFNLITARLGGSAVERAHHRHRQLRLGRKHPSDRPCNPAPQGHPAVS
jgi:hypothetical protein